MREYTLAELRRAAKRCVESPQSDDDALTARSLLESISSGNTAEDIKQADEWFNKPCPKLSEFMARYAEHQSRKL